MGKLRAFIIILAVAIMLSSCSNDRKVVGDSGTAAPPVNVDKQTESTGTSNKGSQVTKPAAENGEKTPAAQKPENTSNTGGKTSKPNSTVPASKNTMIVSNPSDTMVVVNKKRNLPVNWKPSDLVQLSVAYRGRTEARYMRKEASDALDKLFAGAKSNGIELCAVSGFRSYELQKVIFNKYVSQNGEAKARTFSAYPGQSEHQTGLAVDVSSASMNYGLSQSFGNTADGKWLKAHAAEYGFIIRYLKGKESITGYIYEPWHIRYVGVNAAKEIMNRNITLEEYLGL